MNTATATVSKFSASRLTPAYAESKTSLSLVREQLSQYGLNPTEWNLEPSARRNVVRLRHRSDFDFKMKARLTRSKSGDVSISELSLVSL